MTWQKNWTKSTPGRMTVQSMIFEPEPLILHLAMGSCPSSALPMKKLELQPLFKP